MITSFSDFVQKLAFAQLKNTALVDDQDAGIINPGHESQILSLTNKGLIDITSRKKLIQDYGSLTFVTGQNTYILDSLDYPEFVRVLAVHAVMTGNEVIEENRRVFIPKTNRHITQPDTDSVRFSDNFMRDYGPAVDIHYQKNHVTIDETGDINLPSKLHEALELYVSGLYLTHMGGEENKKSGDSYYGLYLKMMGDDEILNTSNTSEVGDDDTRFQDRGFV